ncbi:MAG: gamma-glutamyltransferase family protein [Methylibium sp.]|uniref:gamma-glutamyltransferase family protein n=1 Tax=Methylibium sp. TaxID=2067992 RepID=UPI0017D8C6A2|nr:gamma-glutamyltransferase family protein [Methylibium sp.]MBA3598994.1 gamma-glutamyltransferase family protein [Methylibium sp.]
MQPLAHTRLAAAAALFGALLVVTACSGIGGDDDAAATTQAITDDGSTVIVGSGLPSEPAAPELVSGYEVGKELVYARNYMVVTANPLASQAGCEVLADGGSAVDAAVAVQAVLGLVEPQSSGLGGGAFLIHYDAASGEVQAYDGRETAPAGATADYLRYVGPTDRTEPLPSTQASGRSIGTPGTVRMLELAHQDHGDKDWGPLFDAGIRLATEGFPISGRLAGAIAGAQQRFLIDEDTAALYLDADGRPKALGAELTVPAYAQTLEAIATGGADAFYTGEIAQDITEEIGRTRSAADGSPVTPGATTLADLAAYEAKRRDAVCTTYRAYWVCGMPPPSSGGITVASMLGILENFDLSLYPPTPIDGEGGTPAVFAVHLVSEAGRLAYADRNKYIADTDYVPLPGSGLQTLLNKPYLQSRAALVSNTVSMRTAQPGSLSAVPLGTDTTRESGTSHVTIVDRNGNVVVMTTTVERGFGAWRMARGFILNNELTDFSALPSDADGPIANRVAPGKRPRSSMAPTLVFRQANDGSRGDFLMGTGSPGGSTIIQYVVKTLVGVLDWGLDAQQATSLVNFGAQNSPTTIVGGEHPNVDATNMGANDPLVTGLRAFGHTVSINQQSSGVGTIIVSEDDGEPVLTGGADPRREGIVLGDTFVP